MGPVSRKTGAVLATRAVGVAYGDVPILEDVSFRVGRGRVTALVGPNGSGKSTLLRTLARLLRPATGTVLLDGMSILRLPAREVARRLALLPQSAEVPPGITVRELVGYGRYPHCGPLRRLGPDDHAAIAWAIEVTALCEHQDRLVDTLSGGERQRAWIAMALAQRTGMLLLDEPTTYLDLRHQLEVLHLIRSLNRSHGLTVVWVLHDLNQAAAFSDEVAVLSKGRLFCRGSPGEVLTSETIRTVFGVDTLIVPHPRTGAPVFVPAETP